MKIAKASNRSAVPAVLSTNTVPDQGWLGQGGLPMCLVEEGSMPVSLSLALFLAHCLMTIEYKKDRMRTQQLISKVGRTHLLSQPLYTLTHIGAVRRGGGQEGEREKEGQGEGGGGGGEGRRPICLSPWLRDSMPIN